MKFAKTFNFVLINVPRPPCSICAESNIHRSAIRAYAHLTRSTIPGEGWSIDKFGPLRTKALDGSRYFLLAIDDASRLARAWFLKTKDSPTDLECLKVLHAWSLTQTGQRIKTLRSDGEWISKEFKQFQAQKGFEHLRCTRATASANAIVERHGGILLSMARAMMVNSKAPAFLFAEAFSYAVYIHNRLPRSSYAPFVLFYYLRSSTSYPNSEINAQTSGPRSHAADAKKIFKRLDTGPKMLHGTSSSFTGHHLKVFGCNCVFRVDNRKPAKHEARGTAGIFIGCDSTTRAWRIFVPADRSIHLSRDVVFYETLFWYRDNASKDTPLSSDIFLHEDQSLESESDDISSPLPISLPSSQVQEIPEFQQSPISTGETTQTPSKSLSHAFDPGSVRMDVDLCLGDYRSHQISGKDLQRDHGKPSQAKRTRRYSPSLGQVLDTLLTSTSPPSDIQNQRNIDHSPSTFDSSTMTTPVLSDSTFFEDFSFALAMPSSITVKEALKSPKWRAAMDREVDSLQKLQVFSLIPRKPDMHVIGSRWVLAEKTLQEAHGEPTAKARFVGKGFQQTYGDNYTQTWAPTVSINALRAMIAIAAQHSFEITHLDVRTAFLNAHLPETNIYVEPPEGYFSKDVVLHIHRALYGLKQAGREWYLTLSKTLATLGFSRSKSEPCLFFCHTSSSLTLIVTHVDDLLCAGLSSSLSAISSELSKMFKIKDAGPVTYALGIEFQRTGSAFKLTQTSYTTSLLSHFGFSNCKSSPTPMVTSQPTDAKKTSLSDFKLNEIVGSLLWLSKTTRPDIAFATAILSQHVHNPTSAAYSLASRILRYLKGTVGYGILMKAHLRSSLQLYADADWASDSSRKSHTGVIAFLGGAPIAWISKKQSSVALSSSEAELVAACEATTLAKFFMTLFQELCLPLQLPITVYEDNSGAIHLANTSIRSKRLKHIDIRYQFINDEVTKGNVMLTKIASELNVADIFTKPLPLPKFRSFLPHLISSSSSPRTLNS